MTSTVTSRLIASLPESLWPEAVRRLRRVPELWALAENDEVLQAFLEQADAPRPLSRRLPPVDAFDAAGAAFAWRPGPLALAAYAVMHPECQAKAERWLLGAGREHVGSAYSLLTGEPAALHPVDDAVPAALALRLRMIATADWPALAAEAVVEAANWRLPLQYLWGLLTDGHAEFFTGLVQAGPRGAALAAQCVIVNLSPAETVGFVASLGLSLPQRQWMALADTLVGLGEGTCARAILRPQAEPLSAQARRKDIQTGWNPLDADLNNEVEQALLAAATEDFGLAHPVLTAAWNQVRELRATVAAHIGRLALAAGDLVVAHAGYQDAFSERPEDPALRAALAETLVRLERPGEALALLDGQVPALPAAHLAAAEAHASLEQPAMAHEALAALAQASALSPHPHVLARAARLAHALADTARAAQLMQRAAQAAATVPDYYLTAANWLLSTGAAEPARAMAVEAAALQPQSAEVRETLGQALLACGAPAQAVPHFQSAVSFEPRRLPAALGLARAALAAGDPTLASEAAESILSHLPEADADHPEHKAMRGEAHTLLGQALGALNQPETAFDHFHRASTLVPTAPAPWRAMARHLIEHGDQAQALATLEAGRQALALVSSPKSAPLLSDLADAYLEAGRLTEAILALREAVAADPQAFAEQRRLGSLLRHQGAAAEAVDVLRRALLLQPADGEALYELGQALEKLGRIDEAWSAFQQTVLTRPASAEPYLDLGRLTLHQCRQGALNASPLQAVAALRSAIEHAPAMAEAHGLLAQAQHLAGDPQGALESYQRALHLAPTRTDWSLGLGQVCLDLKQPHIAIACLQEALEHAPENPTVYAAIAQAYAQNALWREARHAADSALRLDPENSALMQLLAEAEAHLGDHEQALKAWRRAVAANPRDAAMQVRLARCLMELGHVDEARSVFAQALALAPDVAEVHLAAGQALAHMGELDEAQRVLALAVEMDPHSAEIQAAYGRATRRSTRRSRSLRSRCPPRPTSPSWWTRSIRSASTRCTSH
jgi:tetratricopeptide (TPR) repeat protein